MYSLIFQYYYTYNLYCDILILSNSYVLNTTDIMII